MSDSTSRPNSKVARVIRKYDLEGLGERLELAWTDEGEGRKSLRDLAEEFNREVLAAALGEATGSTIRNDVSSTYRTLTDDDVSRADRVRKERELDRMGVDVDEVVDDFVTHQAIHTYLTEYRDAELPSSSESAAERKAATLARLRGRTLAVTESTVETLLSRGDITDRQYEVLVDVRVVCEDCGSDYAVDALLRQGGCDCSPS